MQGGNGYGDDEKWTGMGGNGNGGRGDWRLLVPLSSCKSVTAFASSILPNKRLSAKVKIKKNVACSVVWSVWECRGRSGDEIAE